jgi:L,D-transpeptidase-like protein
MPNSIFFTTRGHAIHGTNHTSIGRPASHGCVRLSVEHSAMLFDLVKREGMQNTRVELYGDLPVAAPQVSRRTPSYQQDYQQGYQQDYQRDYQQGYAQPRYQQRDQDDDVTASVPQRGELPRYSRQDTRQERPVYRRYDDPPVSTEREEPYPGPPPFFPFPGRRWN